MLRAFIFLISISLLWSCSSSDVVSSGLIQKRKYRKGLHTNWKLPSLKREVDVAKVIPHERVNNEASSPLEVVEVSTIGEAKTSLETPAEKLRLRSRASERTVAILPSAFPLKSKMARHYEKKEDPEEDEIAKAEKHIKTAKIFLIIGTAWFIALLSVLIGYSLLTGFAGAFISLVVYYYIVYPLVGILYAVGFVNAEKAETLLNRKLPITTLSRVAIGFIYAPFVLAFIGLYVLLSQDPFY